MAKQITNVGFTKEYLIKYFWDFFNMNNRYLTESDLRDKNINISKTPFQRFWGTYTKFLIEMNVLGENGWYKCEEEYLKNNYGNTTKEEIMNSLMKKRSWGTIIQKANKMGLFRSKEITYGENPYDKADVGKLFWKFYKEYKKYPEAKEMDKIHGNRFLITRNRYYSNWDSLLKEIGVIALDNTDGWYIIDENVLREKYYDGNKDDILNSLMVKRKWGTVVHKANSLGLSRNMEMANYSNRRMSEDFLINELMRFYKTFSRVPTSIDFEKNKDYPSATIYQKKFGTWNNALEIAGLEINCYMTHSKEMVIEKVLSFYNENHRSPYYNDLEFNSNLIKNYWENWNEMLKDLNLPLNRKENYLKTKEDGIEFLIGLKDKLDKVPSSTDVENEGINRNWFLDKFGTFKIALFESGLISEEECNIDYNVLAENNIKHLLTFAKELDRVPSVAEYEEYLSIQPNKDYIRRENLCKRLGMTFVEICESYLPKEILHSSNNNFYLNKKNERCKSLAELKISNLFIENNVKYNYETMYKDVMETELNYRFDWEIFFDNKVYYVEYFGFVSEKGNYDLINNYILKTYHKIHLCRENDIPLIELYPKDLENNFTKLIEKFKKYDIILKSSN